MQNTSSPPQSSCVFFPGDDEQSTQMAAHQEDEKPTETSSNSFVAIKIDAKRCTHEYQMGASQKVQCLIYQVHLNLMTLVKTFNSEM